MASFTRTHSSTVTALDGTTPIPLTNWLPKQVFIKHMGKQVNKPGVMAFSPVIAVQFRDWSNSRTSGLTKPTGQFDGVVPVFRPHRTTPILAEVFASWTEAPRGMIVHHINTGDLEVHEDYLGITRKLSSGQVMQYTNRDQPWATFILHRTGLTAADGAPPDVNAVGILAMDFRRIKARPVFTGGTSPTVDVNVWAREALPGEVRGGWGLAASSTGLVQGAEAVFTTDYREIFVEVAAVTGSPTSFNIEVSGTSA